MVTVVAFLLGSYIGWLVWLCHQVWRQDIVLPTPPALQAATVLFAFRNEAVHLPPLLSGLAGQRYTKLHVVAVDDGSTDSSAQIIQQHQAEWGVGELTYLHSSGLQGKRATLSLGLSACWTKYILQTDADCRHQSAWAGQALAAAEVAGAEMLILPLRFRSDSLPPFWLSVINLEFASIMAITCATARAGIPVMCNGANLLYTNVLAQAAAPHMALKPYPGGDDMFLLDFALMQKQKIGYNDAAQVWMETEAPDSLLAFLRQRRRWVAKWPAYTSPWPVRIGAVTILGQVAFNASILLAALQLGGDLLPTLVSGKIVAEAVLLYRQMQKGGMRFSLGAFLFWQLVWLPYVFATTLPTLWRKRPPTWKT